MCGARFPRNISAMKPMVDLPGDRVRSGRAYGLAFALLAMISLSAAPACAKGKGGFFLPSPENAKVVRVSSSGEAAAGITVVTEALAVKQRGPRATVKKFGEVYAFSPQFIAVRRDEPTQIEFWNLQPDDEHDVAILDADLKVLMYQPLPPLAKTSWIFTFHREGLFAFKCLVHQPEMSGQILVLPPAAH